MLDSAKERMALEEIILDDMSRSVPGDVSAFLERAETHIDAHFDAGKNKRYPQFIPCDSALLYSVISFLTDEDHVSGETFCEWGSGLGVGVCLASKLGYEAYGIEIEEELVEAAEVLADEAGVEGVTFLPTSYIPEGLDSYSGVGGDEIVADSATLLGEAGNIFYEGMDCDVSEIDLFFVYPWPSEHEFMAELFDTIASEGAVLIAYYGDGEICAYRKKYHSTVDS